MDENVVLEYKVIFLNVDNVLTSYTFLMRLLFRFSYFIKKEKLFIKVFNPFRVRRSKVKLLKNIIDKTNAKVIMIDDTRFKWFNSSFEKKSKFGRELSVLLFDTNINVLGITPYMPDVHKEDEINMWILNSGFNISNFVILDSDDIQYPHLKEKHLVKTISHENKVFYSYGLTKKTCEKAIEILNS